MLRDLILTIVSLFWAVVLVLVGGRFVALLLGANQDSELIERLYRHSDFWVKPFFNVLGLTNEAVEGTGGTFEPASLLAFIVYFIIGALVIGAIRNSTSYFGGRYHHA